MATIMKYIAINGSQNLNIVQSQFVFSEEDKLKIYFLILFSVSFTVILTALFLAVCAVCRHKLKAKNKAVLSCIYFQFGLYDTMVYTQISKPLEIGRLDKYIIVPNYLFLMVHCIV